MEQSCKSENRILKYTGCTCRFIDFFQGQRTDSYELKVSGDKNTYPRTKRYLNNHPSVSKVFVSGNHRWHFLESNGFAFFRFKRLRRHRTNTSELWFERRMHSVHLQVGSTSPFHQSMFSNLITDPGVACQSEALKQSTCWLATLELRAGESDQRSWCCLCEWSTKTIDLLTSHTGTESRRIRSPILVLLVRVKH